MRPVIRWLTEECRSEEMPLNDFGRLCEQVRPADVVLVEGRTRISGVIQAVTLSSWTHAALYLGRLDELPDSEVAQVLRQRHGWGGERQLLIETEIDQGTLIVPLDKYADYHLRICRPRNLLPEDNLRVRRFALERLGTAYNLRQIFDLLRFFFPYGLLPRRWRSSLFEVGKGEVTRTVCSTLIAHAFMSVRFPILPHIQRDTNGGYVLRARNARLFAPRDFDYSPYFDIIKYPFLVEDDVRIYRQLKWDEQGLPEDPQRAEAAGAQADRR